MSRAHVNSKLSLVNTPIGIDENTIDVFHFDTNATGVNGMQPTGTPIYSIRPDGKFSGAVAVEEATTNLSSIDLTSSSWVKEQSIAVVNTGRTYQSLPIYRITFKAGYLSRMHFDFAYADTESYTSSIYYRFISGQNSGEPLPALYFRETGYGTGYTSTGFPDTSGQWNRVSISYTFTGAGNCMFLLYRATSATTVDIVMEFAMPQLEKKLFATSFTQTSRSAGSLPYVTSFDPAGSWTIFGRAKRNTVSGWQGLFQFGTYYQAGESEFEIWLNHSGQMKAWSHESQSGRYRVFFTPNAGELEEWFTWAITRDGTTNQYKAYIWTKDRYFEDSWIWEHAYPIDYNLGLGDRWILNGLIDEIRIDRVARTSDEIKAWYLSGCQFNTNSEEGVCT